MVTEPKFRAAAHGLSTPQQPQTHESKYLQARLPVRMRAGLQLHGFTGEARDGAERARDRTAQNLGGRRIDSKHGMPPAAPRTRHDPVCKHEHHDSLLMDRSNVY